MLHLVCYGVFRRKRSNGDFHQTNKREKYGWDIHIIYISKVIQRKKNVPSRRKKHAKTNRSTKRRHRHKKPIVRHDRTTAQKKTTEREKKNLQQHNNKDDEPKINDDVTTQQFLMKISRSKLPTKNFFMCMCASV